ncbi:LTA synthase family protein [Clostridium hydrogeniformans]|uniref:LTA synthase family protein n=1 Tax=Clostridium hydrogeniformans TaxID=349933 RepID=UPI00055952F4|nr:LTA synthase family protein [Clostridium hydrogeniformans]
MRNFKFKQWFKKLDKLFFLFGIFIWLKSLLFLALLHGKDSATLNISRMYFSPPPTLSHILFIVIIMSFGFLFYGRGRIAYYISINLLFSLLLIGDLIYFRAYGGFLTFSQVMVPASFNPSNKALLSYLHFIDILFFLDIILGIVYFIKRSHVYKGTFKNIKKNILAFVMIFSLSTGAIYLEHYLIDVKDVTKGSMLFFKVCWAQFQTMSNMSPAGYHIYDIYLQFADNKTKNLTSEEKDNIDQWFKDKKEDVEDNELKGKLKGKNLIFLQIESLENFVIGDKAFGEEITPNINKILNNSLYFNNIYEQVNNGTSSDGDLLSVTSVIPVREGSTVYRYPNNTYNSLPSMLNDMGYNTISTHPEKAYNWNWRPNHRSFGFKKSWDINDYVIDEEIGPGLSDGSFYRQVMEKLDKEKSPFFLHAVTLTSHGPFDVPKKERLLNLPKEFDESIMGSYFQSINYVDRQIGNLINMLKERDMLKDTVLVIYGDHTGVHKFYQDKLNNINGMEDRWKEKDLKVPFIIYNPELNGETRDIIGGQVDMMPTVAYVMGIPEEKFQNTAMGKVLVKSKKNFTVLNYGEIVGTPSSKKEEEHMKNSISIGNKILESNYFKK